MFLQGLLVKQKFDKFHSEKILFILRCEFGGRFIFGLFLHVSYQEKIAFTFFVGQHYGKILFSSNKRSGFRPFFYQIHAHLYLSL